jgi:glycosyltransferase involved in cell wall biosynthesis
MPLWRSTRWDDLCDRSKLAASAAVSGGGASPDDSGAPNAVERSSGIGMLSNRRIAVVLPAYNAVQTLRKTFDDIPKDIVDDIILTDDASRDNTVELSLQLGIHTLRHDHNRGYGANQKTCYAAALARGADIVVMLHPDYQYKPRLLTAMAAMIVSGEYDVVLGSRILGKGALAGGMPVYKYLSNRVLTLLQNLMVGQKLSEYHTGYRAWHRTVLERLPLGHCSDDFVFDNQMLVQAIHFGFRIGEISCPTRYAPESSSINCYRSMIYGLGVLRTSLQYRLRHLGVAHPDLFDESGAGRLQPVQESAG